MNRRGAAASTACTTTPPAPRMANAFPHVAWSHLASLYEVNVRQYTPEGTLAAFEADPPRLAQMGVGILWFMPIRPIGVKERKGTPGSPCAICDHAAVNPEFGTLEDTRRIVAKAHALAMKVILDAVPNHTAWDHGWTTRHPDWHKKEASGQIHSCVYRATPSSQPEYWTDVVGQDSRQPALWSAMTEAMAFWLRVARHRRLALRCGEPRAHAVMGPGARHARAHQAGLHAGRVRQGRPAHEGLRHDLRPGPAGPAAQDRQGSG